MKWEYLCARIDTYMRIDIQVALDSFGKDRWELVTIENKHADEFPIFIFKRPIYEPAHQVVSSRTRAIDMEGS